MSNLSDCKLLRYVLCFYVCIVVHIYLSYNDFSLKFCLIANECVMTCFFSYCSIICIFVFYCVREFANIFVYVYVKKFCVFFKPRRRRNSYAEALNSPCKKINKKIHRCCPTQFNTTPRYPKLSHTAAH